MLTKQLFNDYDIRLIEAIPKSFTKTVLLYLVVFVPVSFLFGLVGLLKKGHGYWLTTVSLLGFFTLVFLFVMLKEYIGYKKDLKGKMKLCGTFTVVKKSSVKYNNIYTDASELKKLHLLDKALFEKITSGDELNIEIAIFTKKIFRLEKEGNNLLEKKL